MATVAEAVRRLRIVQTYETTGADAAIRKGRDLAAAQRDIASTSVTVERQMTATERATKVWEAQAARAAVAAKSFAQAQTGGLVGSVSGAAAAVAGYMAAAAAIGAMARGASDAVEAYQKFEDLQVTLQNALRMTDGAAGRTAAQIEVLVREIGSIDEARQAARGLLGSGLSGDMFDAVLRSAKDLSASGFGGLEASAKAVATALTKPKEGLDALEQAGVRFGARQKSVIVDMVETGRQAEAQAMVLKRLNEAVGGAGAAKDATLTGAYTALSDAMQRGAEQFGQSIANATRLASVIQTLADAINALNDFTPSPGLMTVLKYGSNAIPAVGAIVGTYSALSSGTGSISATATSAGAADTSKYTAGVDEAVAKMKRQRDAYDGVVIGIEKEIAALRKSELARAIEKAQREANVAANSEEGRALAGLVTTRLTETEAIKRAEEARREAEATAKRNAEFSRRATEQRATEIERLLQERDALFMTEEAARAAAIAQAELAKYRERGVPVSDSLRAEIEANAKLRASMEQTNRTLTEAKQLATNFADSFVKGLLDGKTAIDALIPALSSLGSSMTAIGTKSLTGSITSGLSGGSFSFDPVSLGIGAIGTAISLFTGNASKKRAEEQAAAEKAAAAAAAARQRASEYSYRASTAGLDTSTQEGALRQFELNAQRERAQEAENGGAAMAELEQALAAERGAIIEDFAKQAIEAEKELAKQRQGYLDREYTAGLDQSTLTGQLAAFDLSAQREREAEIENGGKALVELERALAAERGAILRDAYQEQVDYYDDLKKTIDDFVSGLNYSDLSTLSPAEQLMSARNDYQTQYDLALSGDRTAQGGITSVAQTLLEQARDYYGPTSAYNDLVQSVTDQLTALPDAAMAQDPQVTELQRLGSTYFDPMTSYLQDIAYNTGGTSSSSGASTSSASTYYANDNSAVVGALQSVTTQLSEVKAELQAARAENAALQGAVARLQAEGNAKTDETTAEVRVLNRDLRQAITALAI